MTREEAIEYWEGLRKTFSSQLEKEENHFGRMHLQTTIDAIDMAISALRQQKHFRALPTQVEPLTNAQKIRAMTDEELAWELILWRCEAVARHHGISSEYPDTQKTILEWLQQPAEEDDHA